MEVKNPKAVAKTTEDKSRRHRQCLRKCQSKLPFGTRMCRWMRRWWPLDWQNMAQFRRMPVDWNALIEALWCILIPIAFYSSAITCLQKLSLPSKQTVSNNADSTSSLAPASRFPSPSRLLVPYLCSPWTCHHLHRGAYPVMQLAQTASSVKDSESITLPEAWESLSQSIQQGRVYRTRCYDVYLPPSTPEPSIEKGHEHLLTVKNNHTAILFLPGFGVEYTAYANPARMLSDLGYTVIVVSAEPWRAVSHNWLHSPKFVSRCIIKRVEDTHKNIKHWLVVGHSLGGFTASHLIPALRELDHSIQGLAMWGVAPFVKALNNISMLDLEVVVINGSNDAIVLAFGSDDLFEEFWQLLPQCTKQQLFIIPNGTHSGFADYKSKSPLFQENNSEAYKQHQKAVGLTNNFFQSRPHA